MSDYVTFYPGVYFGKEKEPLEKYMVENKALNERGEIDVEALIKGKLPEDTPGIGPTLAVTEAMVRYNNAKYDPENQVLNDADYARKLGYQDILAYPTYGAYDDFFKVPYPAAARDKWSGSDLNHSVTNYKPVYPGDTLYYVRNSNHITDLTPEEGSITRVFPRRSEGSVYNQKGEKINDVVFRFTTLLKVYKDDKRPEKFDPRDPTDFMRRPVHYYTDDDWDYIKDLWSKEKRQGAEPLYWEDVRIGDEPAWTIDGPIEESVIPTSPYGMGTGGNRTLKKEIMNHDILKTMIRSEKDGIYRMPRREDYFPPVPDITPPAAQDHSVNTVNIHKMTEIGRAVLVNFMGRDIAIRHINNWMGDHGWLHHIGWGIGSPVAYAAYGKTAAYNPDAVRYLERIPKMKGRHVIAHGLTGDLAIVKSQVYGKYVRDGEFIVELGWWIETIDGYIWEEGGAIVKLPSKNVK